MNRNIV